MSKGIVLKNEQRYDFRKRMVEAYAPNLRDFDVEPEGNEYVLRNGIGISGEDAFGQVVKNAAKDFRAFLEKSMMVKTSARAGSTKDIILKISDDLGEYNTYKGYRIEITDRIIISGYDERGLAQALYNLEDVLALRRAPYLKKGTYARKPMFTPMMVHSGYGFDQFPDEYLQQIARSGRDAIMIFVNDLNGTPHGELDFNDVIDRAAKYGIDVYAYSNLLSKVHPSEADAEAYYESTYGRLFSVCPGFKGVILCGESIEFPSRDPHVSSFNWRNNFVDGIPTGKPSPGWFPCCDYPEWLRLLQKIIYKYRQDADIVFWSYNWSREPEEDRVRLIENLPEGITLQATFEMGDSFKRGEVMAYSADYTLSFEGPSPYFESEARAAKKRGIKLYAMTNTAGLTWDFGVIPYEPMAQQWQKRYEQMVRARDEWGLSGIMECHHYGMYPSLLTRLSKWTFTEPSIPKEALLQQTLAYEFGETVINEVCQVLQLWSEAVTHYTPSNADQYGAFRVGPSYPFCLDSDIKMQFAPDAVGKNFCHTTYMDNDNGRGATFVSLRVPEEIKSLEKMKELFEKGLHILDSIEHKNKKLLYLVNLGHYMLHCIITGIHAKQWYCLKCDAKAERNREKLLKIITQMEKLLQDEIKNAEQTIAYVQRDSRLGWEPSMEYIGDEWHIRWKIRQTNYVLNTELERWKQDALR